MVHHNRVERSVTYDRRNRNNLIFIQISYRINYRDISNPGRCSSFAVIKKSVFDVTRSIIRSRRESMGLLAPSTQFGRVTYFFVIFRRDINITLCDTIVFIYYYNNSFLKEKNVALSIQTSCSCGRFSRGENYPTTVHQRRRLQRPTVELCASREPPCTRRIGNRLLKNVRMRVRHTFLSGLSLFPIVFVSPPVAIVRSSPNQIRPTGNIAAVGCSTFAVNEMRISSAEKNFSLLKTPRNYFIIFTAQSLSRIIRGLNVK